MKLRILLSYHYYKDTDLDTLFAKYFTEPYPDVFADSGAFSAMTQGVKITCAEYATWVKRWQHLFSVYSNLDVIGNADGTKQNQEKLESMGLVPLPVFHTGSDWSYLERLIEKYSYIALGGMVPFMRFPKRIMPFLIKAFGMAKDKAVFHGFGATAWVVMSSLPWYSVDSSSWGQGFRYGQVPMFDSQRGKFIKCQLGDRKAWKKHSALVRSLGFNPLDFADRERNDRAKICAISALSYMKAEQWLRKRHGEVVIPGREDVHSGPNVHLVTAEAGRSGKHRNSTSNMGVGNLAQSTKDQQDANGVRLHLADTSNGINWGDADKGVKLHLADARGHTDSEIAAAESGLKLHLVEHSLDRGGG